MPHNRTVAVAEQWDLGSGYHLLRLEAPDLAATSRAGQFVMLGLPEINAMLIRRPFSVARVAPDPADGPPRQIEVLYKVFGNATLALSRLRKGDSAAVLGPLGHGFSSPDDGSDLVLVAGGIGNAIFPLLLQQIGATHAKPQMIFGGRSRTDLTLLDWFQERCAVITTTEDGTHGEKGRVTAPLQRLLDDGSNRRRIVMTCGPHPMLRAVAQLCEQRGVVCQVATEETMACGFGVCLGCVIPKRNPTDDFEKFVRVCCEGPVFDSREIVL
ncbi:MAG: dihydroorotate dehydrogenase electron transfer subunit [Acidobacteriota bacterium]